MRCLVVLNAREPEDMSEDELRFYSKTAGGSDKIICADGGLNLALRMGITPDIVIGDMDSVKEDILFSIDAEIIRYPKEKDLTDGFLALQKAIEIGCDDVVIINALSSVMDHSLANIQMLYAEDVRNANAMISEPDVDVYVTDSELTLRGNEGDRVSILPLSEKAEGISIEGMKYGLKNGEFSIYGRNGISNEMSVERARIRVENGVLVVFHYRDR